MRYGAYLSIVLTALLVLLAAPAAAQDEHDIGVTDDGFQPEEIEIDSGDTVIWHSAIDDEVVVRADDGSWASGPLERGDTFSLTFRSPDAHVVEIDGRDFTGLVLVAGGDDVVEGDPIEPGQDDEFAEGGGGDEADGADLPETGFPLLASLLLGLGLVGAGSVSLWGGRGRRSVQRYRARHARRRR